MNMSSGSSFFSMSGPSFGALDATLQMWLSEKMGERQFERPWAIADHFRSTSSNAASVCTGGSVDCRPSAGQGSRVLVVADIPAISARLSSELHGKGLRVKRAFDGSEGFEIAQSSRFDLIIAQADMRGLSGAELCERLWAAPLTRSVPVIMLEHRRGAGQSGFGSTPKVQICYARGQISTELGGQVVGAIKKAMLSEGRKVLIIDSSKAHVEEMRHALQAEGLDVFAAGGVSEAFALSSELRPDLIICDMHLPEMDLYTFCRTMRSQPDMAGAPFIVTGSVQHRSTMRRALSLGQLAFMLDPINMDHLVVTAEKLISYRDEAILDQKHQAGFRKSSLFRSIESLMRAFEERDQYNRRHSEVVASIMAAMARRMGLCSEEVDTAFLVGALHDLGKIGIRDDILLKPGPLSSQEYEIIKTHPAIAERILTPLAGTGDVIPGVASHHEYFDGTGYPMGLKRDSIPLFGRMVAVADMFHALISERPYRKALPLDVAVDIIEDVKGSKLCPECVNVFVSWLCTMTQGVASA